MGDKWEPERVPQPNRALSDLAVLALLKPFGRQIGDRQLAGGASANGRRTAPVRSLRQTSAYQAIGRLHLKCQPHGFRAALARTRPVHPRTAPAACRADHH